MQHLEGISTTVPYIGRTVLKALSTRGGPKNNRNCFFKWFIRFYAITTLVSFKVLSF